MGNEEQNRLRKTLGEATLREMAKNHIKGKMAAVEIMKRTDIDDKEKERLVLEIVKHKMYLPIIRLMAGLPE